MVVLDVRVEIKLIWKSRCGERERIDDLRYHVKPGSGRADTVVELPPEDPLSSHAPV